MSDQLVRAISKDGFVKAAAVSTRELTERARQIHQTLPVATAALGRLLAAGSMMGSDLKGEGASVTLRIKGDGPWERCLWWLTIRATSGAVCRTRRRICQSGQTASWMWAAL